MTQKQPDAGREVAQRLDEGIVMKLRLVIETSRDRQMEDVVVDAEYESVCSIESVDAKTATNKVSICVFVMPPPGVSPAKPDFSVSSDIGRRLCVLSSRAFERKWRRKIGGWSRR
jgi:hypothetical protein